MSPKGIVPEGDLQTRLNFIIQEVPYFWEQGPHSHFTSHGPSHSERVHRQKLGQLAQELPEEERLSNDEIFIVSAAAWLYDIGMQSTNLRPRLGFDFRAGESLSFSQLQLIRENKHLLTYDLILANVRNDLESLPLRLGLLRSPDDYTRVIADVCRWCSDEPLEEVPEKLPVSGLEVRVRLLVALLRLADQLYIDSPRVNFKLLQMANIPLRLKAQWWTYHYAQTLPIEKGKIRFHYYLPIAHRPLLGHIRALTEKKFRENNPIIHYLWDEHGLKLITDDYFSVKYDQPAGFQLEMSSDLVRYLRHNVEPLQPAKPVTPQIDIKEHSLLLALDYENFILQLGQEGYFLSPKQISRLVVTLLTKAREEHELPVEGWAVGHWNRADLLETAKLLSARVYKLITVDDHEKPSEKLARELMGQLQSVDLPKQILLVAPHQDLAQIVNQFRTGNHSISAWISNLPDADIYRAVAQQFKLLSQLLELPSTDAVSRSELVNAHQAAGILTLDEEIANNRKDGISIEEVSLLLQHVEQVNNRGEWWRLWLINQEILTPTGANGQYLLKLNSEHPSVVEVRHKRQAVIESLQTMGQDDQSVPEDTLVKKLRTLSHFRSENTVSFLELLKDVDILHRLSSPYDGRTLWHLNPSNPTVVALNADRYLPLLVLTLDHFLVQEGYVSVHEHTIVRRLTPYLGESVAETVYQLAIKKGLVERQTSNRKRRHRDEYLVDVYLVDHHEQVAITRLNCDILLSVLNHKSARDGLQRDALLQRLDNIEKFTLDDAEVDRWLDLLQKESVIDIKANSHDKRRDSVRLNLNSRLTRRLRGRLNIYSLIRNLRMMRATRPNQKQPSSKLVDRLTQYVTRGDRQLAGWTLDYAKSIKLVRVEKCNSPNGTTECVYLNRHRFVHSLDQREEKVGQALVKLVPKLARRNRDGWVPRHVVLRKMEKDKTFGYAREEREYWLDQAIHRLRLLEQKTERRPRFTQFVRLLTKEQKKRHRTKKSN